MEFLKKFNFHVKSCTECKGNLVRYANKTQEHNHPICDCGAQPIHLNHQNCEDCKKLWNTFVSIAMKHVGKFLVDEGLKNIATSIKRKMNWRH